MLRSLPLLLRFAHRVADKAENQGEGDGRENMAALMCAAIEPAYGVPPTSFSGSLKNST